MQKVKLGYFTHYNTQNKKIAAHKNRTKKFVDFKELRNLSNNLKKRGKKIVFTTGTFDLLNPGHCRFLAEARSRGDVLVVGVATDHSVKQEKGHLYPLINQDLRAELVSYLKTVDFVTFCEEDRPHGVLALLQPDIFYTSVEDSEDAVIDEQKKYLVESYGGQIIKRVKHKPYFGTNSLVSHIANIRVLQILDNYLQEKIKGFNLNPTEHLYPADYEAQDPIYENAFNPTDKIIRHDDINRLRDELHSLKKKTVFVSGSYDLLHTGHARFIERAGILGDLLIVGIPSDVSLRQLKGIGRPVISEIARAFVLANLDLVNYVVIFDDLTVLNTLKRLQPHVFFTVDESWNKGLKESPEYNAVMSYGGEVALAERQSPFLSSSAIINKVAVDKVKEIFKECMEEEKYKSILDEKSRFNGN